MNTPVAPPRDDSCVEEALMDRARQDYDHERAAAWKHTLTCRWCSDGPCPMGLAVRENAESYGRHLAAIAAEAAQREGIAWA